jgi:succinate-semialdehyde dehydrogenase/glutarate-semialdehyde dehydrogenase
MMAIPNVARRSNLAYLPLSHGFFRIFVQLFSWRSNLRLCPISDSEERVMSIATTNPATGEVLRSFEPITDAQLEDKLQRAVEAFDSFRRTSFASRATLMLKAADILEADKEKFARMMTTEMGKTYRSAVDEAVKCAWVCRYYAERAEKFLADEVADVPGSKSFVRYLPLGPILAVMPWNYPFWQVFRFIAPSLMAGNVGLLKHASNVPQSALMIEEVLLRAGFPEGVFQTLLIGSNKVAKILADPRIKAATLTGSEGAGVQVGIAAATDIKKVVLELGGSDPFIVMKSANLEQAVAVGVKARVLNNGQSCIAAKRFIVAEEIADEFERLFVKKMESLKVGDPFDEHTDIGPLSSAEALKELDADVQKTIRAGARLLTGGKRLNQPGNYYLPTVLADIPKDSPAACGELFGPVASLFRAKNAEDAIRIANSSPFGLGASAWTNDSAEREKFINGLESGMVFINRMVASDPRLPFGGVKRSGHGRELAMFGIREFMNIKTVSIEGA